MTIIAERIIIDRIYAEVIMSQIFSTVHNNSNIDTYNPGSAVRLYTKQNDLESCSLGNCRRYYFRIKSLIKVFITFL